MGDELLDTVRWTRVEFQISTMGFFGRYHVQCIPHVVP
jgi:hypothetical protein